MAPERMPSFHHGRKISLFAQKLEHFMETEIALKVLPKFRLAGLQHRSPVFYWQPY
jgi:hypothetical protein